MGAIFLSYAREDRAWAERLARVLEAASHQVWWDQYVRTGAEFSAEIEAALEKADVVLVAWSKEAAKSPWVRDEAAIGRDSGRLLPVLVDGGEPPIGFRQFQALDLSGWKARDKDPRTKELIDAVEAQLAGKSAQFTRVKRRLTWLRKRLGWAAAAAVALVVAAATLVFMINRERAGGPTAAPTVALLPFVADSSDPDARKLAAATRDAVAHTLSQGTFAVSTIDAAPKGGRAPADFLVSGRTSTTPYKVVTSVQMEETAHHVVVFTHQFEAMRDKAWNLPEQVGAQVASQLSWTAPLIAMEGRHTSDPAILASLFQGGAAEFGSVSDLADYEKARGLAARTPNSPLAQDSFAFATAFVLDQIPRQQRAEAVNAARRAADRTIELAPEFGGGYIPWCLLHSEQRMVQCEDRLRLGMRADPDAAFVNWFLSRLLHSVGRIGEAADLARLSLAHDPYMPLKIAQALRLLEATGRTDEAAQLYDQSRRWWPADEEINRYRQSGMALLGDFEAVQRFNKQFDPQLEPNPVLAAINSKSLARTRDACPPQVAANEFRGFLCMLALARYGDLDAAFAIADRLYPSRRGRTPPDEERIWLDQPGTNMLAFLTSPAAAPLRRDARYLAIAERVGLLEYWRSGRPPDFCRAEPEPICSQLLKRS